MITANPDIKLEAVREVLQSHWGIAVDRLQFLPVGADSWSFRAGDLLINVRSASGQRKPWSRACDVEASLAAATALRARCDLEFLLTPMPTKTGRPVARIGSHVVSAFPYIDGVMSYETPLSSGFHAELASWIERLHSATSAVADLQLAREDFVADFSTPLIRALERAVSGEPEGPYTARVQELVQRAGRAIADALHRHETYAAQLRSREVSFVVTHGEPTGNVLLGTEGDRYLIDLAELMLAPPERDLQDLEPAVQPPSLDEDLVSFYKSRFALSEIAEYADRLSQDHDGDAEDDRAWEKLNRYVSYVR